MIQKILLIVAILVFPTLGWGQSVSTRLIGQITNDAGETLPGASVFINDSIQVISNEEGIVNYTYRGKFPAAVVARYVGCLPRRVILNTSDIKNNAIRFTMVLNTETGQLNEVNIDAGRIQQIAEEDFTTDIFDFEFIDNKILLLMRVKKKYYLRLTSESGKQYDQIQLPYPAKRLFRSCLNGLHVVGEQFAQEITLQSKEKLDTLPRYPKTKFTNLLEPCVAENKGIYYFKKDGTMHQSVEYHYIGADGEWNQLAVISNKAGLEEAEKALLDFFTGKPMTGRRGGDSPPIDDEIGHVEQLYQHYSMEELLRKAQTNGQIARLADIERIETDSVYAPLMKSGDTIFLFDHVHAVLSAFTKPNEDVFTVPINYQTEKGWQTQLFYDRRTHRFYAFYMNEGHYSLTRINTQTGSISARYPLNEMPLWSKNIKIFNGYLYYLGQENPNIPNYVLKKIDFQRHTSQN